MGRSWRRIPFFLLAGALTLGACRGDATPSATTALETTPAPPATAETDPPTTTTTEAPTTTAPTLDLTTEGGDTSRNNPVPMGQTVDVGHWRLRVTSVTADATELILEDDFNEPPADGDQYFLARLEATHVGDASAELWSDLTLSAVGDTAVAYQQFVDVCGLVPEDINQSGEVLPGGTVFGNVCWAIETTDAESLVMIVEAFQFGEDRVFLSLDPSADPIDDTTSVGDPTLDRSAAIPLGEAGAVGPWEVRVTSVTPDATERVLSEASFNEPPAQDHQFFIAALQATYTGPDSSDFFLDMTVESVGDSSVIYSPFNADCGFIPDNINLNGEAFAGGTITGNVCWQIRSSDANSMVMLVSEFGFDTERFWFSLTN